MHLSSEEALDLIEGRAVEDQVRFWNDHFQKCSSCRDQFNSWQEMHSLLKRTNLESAPRSAIGMAEALFEPAPGREPSGLRKLVASLVFDSFAQPAFAGTRGATTARQFLFAAEDFDIHVRVWGMGGERRLTGQISLRGQEEIPPGIPIHLVDDGKRLVTTLADKFGDFEFTEVPEGSLQLQVDLPRLTIMSELNLGPLK